MDGIGWRLGSDLVDVGVELDAPGVGLRAGKLVEVGREDVRLQAERFRVRNWSGFRDSKGHRGLREEILRAVRHRGDFGAANEAVPVLSEPSFPVQTRGVEALVDRDELTMDWIAPEKLPGAGRALEDHVIVEIR